MPRPALFLVAAIFLVQGELMLTAPQTWYTATPGVDATGPFNGHFVTDIAFAALASGVLMAWGAASALRPLALAGALWPGLHALFHLEIWIARGLPLDTLAAVNAAGIQLPAWLALWAAWRMPPLREETAPC